MQLYWGSLHSYEPATGRGGPAAPASGGAGKWPPYMESAAAVVRTQTMHLGAVPGGPELDLTHVVEDFKAADCRFWKENPPK